MTATETVIWIVTIVIFTNMISNLYRELKRALHCTSTPTLTEDVKRYFFLPKAVLCSVCDCVFSCEDFKYCPSCGSTNNFFVSLSLRTITSKDTATLHKDDILYGKRVM